MKERNKLIIALVAVALIIVAVVSATYAWWTWTTNSSEQTTVSFTVPDGSTLLNASLNGGTLTVDKLAPVSSCTNTHGYAKKATVILTYTNNTTAAAKIYGTLKVTNFTSPHGTPTATDLSHLHFALTTSSSSCTSNFVDGKQSAQTAATGTFSGKTANNSALFTDLELKSNITAGTTNGTQTMYLYVWLDGDYSYTQNVGSGNVNDPMEDISFTLTWSGTITNQ